MAGTKLPSRQKTAADMKRQLGAVTAPRTLTPFDYRANEAARKPQSTNINDVYAQSRYWYTESSFLRAFLKLKESIWNADFSLTAIDPKQDEQLAAALLEDAPAVQDSFVDPVSKETITVESNATVGDSISNFVRQAWKEFFMFEACLAYWVDNTPAPYVLQLERMQYQNIFGVEIIRYSHQLAGQQIELLPDELKKRFAKPLIVFSVSQGDHYKIYKESQGYENPKEPSIYSLFRLLSQTESMETGQDRMGSMLRSVVRRHRLGHSIQQGPFCGRSDHFWKKSWSDSVKKQWEGLEGIAEIATRHDHEIEYPWPDLKVFDENMWAGVYSRQGVWGGPLFKMLNYKSQNPHLPNLLRAEATRDRREFGYFLDWIVSHAFGIKIPCKCSWSNLVFNEPRLQFEIMKFASMQGQSSNKTSRYFYGLNEGELALKKAEAEDPDAETTSRPLWDQSHGISPALGETVASIAAESAKAKGQGAGSTNGRKPGSKSTK